MKCPKCNGEMREGVVTWADNGIYRVRLTFVWGKVKKGFFGGKTVKVTEGEAPLKSYACEQCGYVERYLDRD